MSENKENTVGWWLDRLKEPLRSRALEYPVLGNGAMSMASAVEHLIVWLRMTTEEFDKKLDAMAFWTGVKDYYHGGKKRQTHNPSYKDGWDMAKECAPDGNGLLPKTISIPIKTENHGDAGWIALINGFPGMVAQGVTEEIVIAEIRKSWDVLIAWNTRAQAPIAGKGQKAWEEANTLLTQALDALNDERAKAANLVEALEEIKKVAQGDAGLDMGTLIQFVDYRIAAYRKGGGNG